MSKCKKSFLFGMLIFPFLTSQIMPFGQLKNEKWIEEKSSTFLAPFSEALPRSFFGDYSNPDFWSNLDTQEIVYQDPQSDDFIFHPHHNGIGIWFFDAKTMVFHAALSHNYEAKYQDQYKSFVTQDAFKNGFLGIDPNWSILDLSYYLEDWIVWNCNESLDYDRPVSDGGVGRTITNDDINLKWGNFSLKEDKAILRDTKIHDYRNLGEYISIGSNDIDWKYLYYYTNQPLSTMAGYDGSQKAWIYQIYPLDRIIYPSVKPIITDYVSNLEFHKVFREQLTLENNMNDFANWVETYLYQTVNRDFINLYGAENIDHTYQEGYYDLESINHQNSSLSFYDSNNRPILIAKNSTPLSSYKEIKIKMVVESSETSIGQEYNNIFFPLNELVFNFESHLKGWQIFLIVIASLVTLFFLVNFLILIYSVWKQK